MNPLIYCTTLLTEQAADRRTAPDEDRLSPGFVVAALLSLAATIMLVVALW